MTIGIFRPGKSSSFDFFRAFAYDVCTSRTKLPPQSICEIIKQLKDPESLCETGKTSSFFNTICPNVILNVSLDTKVALGGALRDVEVYMSYLPDGVVRQISACSRLLFRYGHRRVHDMVSLRGRSRCSQKPIRSPQQHSRRLYSGRFELHEFRIAVRWSEEEDVDVSMKQWPLIVIPAFVFDAIVSIPSLDCSCQEHVPAPFSKRLTVRKSSSASMCTSSVVDCSHLRARLIFIPLVLPVRK